MQTNHSFFNPALSLLCSAFLSARAQAQPAYTELISPNNRAGGGFGYEFGGLPDLTRDGVGEFYVGGDRLYIYDGNSAKPLYSVNCARGPQSAGDLTGDGIPDLMAGNGCAGLAGAVKFINGTNGTVLFSLTSPNSKSDGLFGQTLRLLPDMTGDGKEDWLIHQQEFQSRAGRVYIFDSQTRQAVRTIQNTEAAYKFWVEFVEVIPDVDGDGKPELLVSTKNASVTRGGQTFSNAGRAIVRSLQTGAVLYELIEPEPETDGWFGFALSGTGDITGDGIADIAVGTFKKDNGAGVIYLFNGADGKWLRTVRSPKPQSDGRFGRRIESLPDLNGDGVPELWTQEDGLQLSYVLDGATSALLKTIEYPGEFANLFFIGTVRQQAPPGIRAYLFGSEFVANSEGRAYFMPFAPFGPPRLTALGRSATGFRLQVIGEPGRKLEIQATGDFNTWAPIATVTLGDQPREVEDSAASQPQRFYRAVQSE